MNQGEINSLASLAVPDDAMSMREIVSRFTRGQRIPDNLMRNASYDDQANFDSHDLSEVSRMDIVDRHEIMQENAEKISKKKLFLQQAKAKAAAARDALASRKAAAGETSSHADEPEPGSDVQGGGRRTTTSKKRAGSGDRSKGSPTDYPEGDS